MPTLPPRFLRFKKNAAGHAFQFCIALAISCWLITICHAESTHAPIRFLLSFDDGPSGSRYLNSTEKILDTLASNTIQPGIKALFFTQTRAITGGGTAHGREILQREWDEGHLLGFHTATPLHTSHRQLSDQELQQTLEDGIADLTLITANAPKLVRPPYWSFDERTFVAYQKNGLHLLLTDLSAKDGKIWGINFSLTRHSNMRQQLAKLREKWRSGTLPVIDGVVPVIVTFHDTNSYTANHMKEYLGILLQVADELAMPTARLPFYSNREELERAASGRTLRDLSDKPKLPGMWNWLVGSTKERARSMTRISVFT